MMMPVSSSTARCAATIFLASLALCALSNYMVVTARYMTLKSERGTRTAVKAHDSTDIPHGNAWGGAGERRIFEANVGEDVTREERVEYAVPFSGWNRSRSVDCGSGHTSHVAVQEYQNETTSGNTCMFSTFTQYTQCRMRSANAKLFGHFADRRWINQWRRNECCGARVPRLLGFFPPGDEEQADRCLRDFVAPGGGAVMKLNHKAGFITALKPGAQLSEGQVYLSPHPPSAPSLLHCDSPLLSLRFLAAI